MTKRAVLAGAFDFEATVRRCERLARRVLEKAGFFACGLSNRARPAEIKAASAESGVRRWVDFEGTLYPDPEKGSLAALALAFLQELRLARLALRDRNADQAARLAFIAALAFVLLLDGPARGRAWRRKVNADADDLRRLIERYRAVRGPRRSPVKEAAAFDLGVSVRTLERHLKAR